MTDCSFKDQPLVEETLFSPADREFVHRSLKEPGLSPGPPSTQPEQSPGCHPSLQWTSKNIDHSGALNTDECAILWATLYLSSTDFVPSRKSRPRFRLPIIGSYYGPRGSVDVDSELSSDEISSGCRSEAVSTLLSELLELLEGEARLSSNCDQTPGSITFSSPSFGSSIGLSTTVERESVTGDDSCEISGTPDCVTPCSGTEIYALSADQSCEQLVEAFESDSDCEAGISEHRCFVGSSQKFLVVRENDGQADTASTHGGPHNRATLSQPIFRPPTPRRTSPLSLSCTSLRSSRSRRRSCKVLCDNFKIRVSQNFKRRHASSQL